MKNHANKISVIIPAYNEEVTIRNVILDFHKYLPKAYLYIIDNNSKDKTGKIAAETLKKFKAKGEVIFVSRQGKANAVRTAFSQIDSDIYVMVDADMTYPAEDLKNLLQPVLDDEADMVVGDRHISGAYKNENKRGFHNLGNTLVKKLINRLFNARLNDIMSGYRVFNKKFVKNYPILCEGFEIETDMTLHALDKRFRIIEIPTNYKDRPAGSFSKLNTFKDGFRVIKTIFVILKDYKPLYFFGCISFFLFLIGLLCGYPVIAEFIKTKYVSHVPLAILSTGFMLFSLFALSIGLILDTVEKIQRFNYEQKLVHWKNK